MVTKEQPSQKSTSEAVNSDPFAGVKFDTVYEGIGETWDFEIHPVLVGVYQRKSTSHMLKYGSKTEMEDRMVYTIKTASGDLAAVWESFALRAAFEDIPTGKVVRITYNGKDEIKDTDKEVKDFTVEVGQ